MSNFDANYERWKWMMDWCKAKKVSPANPYWWEQSRIAYDQFITTGGA